MIWYVIISSLFVGYAAGYGLLSLLRKLNLHYTVYSKCVKQGNVQDGSELAKQMPQLTKLKRALYSQEYRAFIEKITGLEAGTLTDEVRKDKDVKYTLCKLSLLELSTS